MFERAGHILAQGHIHGWHLRGGHNLLAPQLPNLPSAPDSKPVETVLPKVH